MKNFNYTRVEYTPRSCNVIVQSLVKLTLDIFIHFVELIKVLYFYLNQKKNEKN